MAQRVVGVDVRLAAAVARRGQGERLNVAGVCRELGISRQTFYVYERRFAAQGLTAVLTSRSRAPKGNSRAVGPAVEELIVRLRKQLLEDGWDAGALTIVGKLGAAMAADPELAGLPVPSRATVHRVLRRRGQVVDEPRKRPASAGTLRFEYTQPNACWQVDALFWRLADGTQVAIVQVIDDHSRLLLADRAASGETSEAVWAALSHAIGRYGPPCQVLSDRGAAMLGAPGTSGTVRTALTELGIKCITTRGYHPQTNGKNERVHQTLQRWLTARLPAIDLPALQALLEEFEHAYNHDRAHQALAGRTPATTYEATAKAIPTSPPHGSTDNSADIQTARNTVTSRGVVSLAGPWETHLGREWEGCIVTVVRQGLHAHVWFGEQLLREVTIDPSRRYQPSGKPTSRPSNHARPRVRHQQVSAMS